MTDALLSPLEERLRRELAIPYVAVVYSVDRGEKSMRRAEYPELPDCAVEAFDAVEAMELLEDLRVNVIIEAVLEGRELPNSREPLSGGSSGLSDATLQSIVADAVERGRRR